MCGLARHAAEMEIEPEGARRVRETEGQTDHGAASAADRTREPDEKGAGKGKKAVLFLGVGLLEEYAAVTETELREDDLLGKEIKQGGSGAFQGPKGRVHSLSAGT